MQNQTRNQTIALESSRLSTSRSSSTNRATAAAINSLITRQEHLQKVRKIREERERVEREKEERERQEAERRQREIEEERTRPERLRREREEEVRR